MRKAQEPKVDVVCSSNDVVLVTFILNWTSLLWVCIGLSAHNCYCTYSLFENAIGSLYFVCKEVGLKITWDYGRALI